MLVIIPIASSDCEVLPGFAQAIERNSNDGAYLEDNVLLVVTPQVMEEQPEMLTHVNRIASLFAQGDAVTCENTPDGGWPLAPNIHFMYCIMEMLKLKYNEPFLYLEADTVPIRRGWLNRLKSEYHDAGKPYMGVVAETLVLWEEESKRIQDRDRSGMDGAKGKVIQYLQQEGDHMVGMGIYPSDYVKRSRKVEHGVTRGQEAVIDRNVLWNQLHAINNGKPFDVIMQGYHKPCHKTAQILHKWHTANYRVEDGQVICDDFEEPAIYQRRYPTGQTKPFKITHAGPVNLNGVCLVHGCKDGTLAELVLNDELPESDDVPVIPSQYAVDPEKVALKRENEQMREAMTKRPGGNKTILQAPRKKVEIKQGGRRLVKASDE